MPQSPSSEKRRIGIAVDFNEESAYAVKWAVSNYIHPEDMVILLHVQATDVLFGADWGDLIKTADSQSGQQQNEQAMLSLLRSSKLIEPLQEGKVPYKIHVVKDYDKKERICLEAERLRLSSLIMGDQHKIAKKRPDSDSVSNYCMHHCECPVLVVGYDGNDDASKLMSETATLSLESKI